ncbi:MAG: tetratricopeptide repeat protein, partial [Myxococcota bacterium]
PAHVAAPVQRAPEDLLERANGLRGARRYSAAERASLEVVRLHPRTRAAYVAQVAAAGLRLDRLGRARAAGRLYRAALRRGGPLDAEVRYGLSRVAARVGPPGEERRALERLLAEHPGSPYAATARRRLAMLEGE